MMKNTLRVLCAIGALSLYASAAWTKEPLRMKITANGHVLHATLEDNAAARELWKRLPLELPMDDLYAREMCHHLEKALPYDATRSDNYAVGDIIYWPPRRSFVILYEQNGEEFTRVQLGHIEKGAELFSRTGDCTVKFERE